MQKRLDQICHKGFKTLKQIERAEYLEYEKDIKTICEDCGGDLKRPTGLDFIHRDEMF